MDQNRGQAIHPGIIGLGIAKSALKVAKDYLSAKPQLWDYQHTRMVMSELIIQTHSLQLMIYNSADLADQYHIGAAQAVMEAKVLAAHVCVKVVDRVMQLCGAQGYVRGHRIERLYRDAKAIGIMGPKTELSNEYVASDWWTKDSDEGSYEY
ncbi:MAG: acyl-CoA dehydrogenase family protein [Firmicutes bacterium]|nr:acyl-CoA dehydrogenase family protein [Bacillota bacterium]